MSAMIQTVPNMIDLDCESCEVSKNSQVYCEYMTFKKITKKGQN